jgi:hypothetical protein
MSAMLDTIAAGPPKLSFRISNLIFSDDPASGPKDRDERE